MTHCRIALVLSAAGLLASVPARAHESFDEPIAFDPRTGNIWFLQGWTSSIELDCEGYNLRLVEYDARGYERAILPLWTQVGSIPGRTPRHYRTLQECNAAVPERVRMPPMSPTGTRDLVRERRPHPGLTYDLSRARCSANGLQAVAEGFVPKDILESRELWYLHDPRQADSFLAVRVKIQHPAGGIQAVEYFGYDVPTKSPARFTWFRDILFVTWGGTYSGNQPLYSTTTEVIQLNAACDTRYGVEPRACSLRRGQLNQAELEIGIVIPERLVPPRCAPGCKYCSEHKDPLHKGGACIQCKDKADCSGSRVCASDGTCRSLKDTSASSLRFRVATGAAPQFRASPSSSAELVTRPAPDCLKHLGITVFDEGVEWWFVDLGGTRAWVDMRTLDLVSTDGSCAKSRAE